MADVSTFMAIDAGDIASIMGIDVGDISTVMGVDYPAGTLAWAGTRGVVAGGEDGNDKKNIIQYKTVASDANTSDFGDLNYYVISMVSSGSNISRGIFAGGSKAASPTGSSSNGDIADYITVGSTGNGTDFGDLNAEGRQGFVSGGSSNGTYLFGGGGYQYNGGFTAQDRMEYFTIASTGNGTDAGNISETKWNLVGTSGNSRYLVATGYNGSTRLDTIEYNDFSTSADVSDFGDMSDACYQSAGVESAARAVIAQGTTAAGGKVDVMEYVTVASTGNVTDFGDITVGRSESGSYSDGTRGEWTGGEVQDGHAQPEVDTIEKITIGSTGNSSDVGDLEGDGKLMGGLSGT